MVLILAVSMAVALAATSSAQAQASDARIGDSSARSGLTIGGGFGVGHLGCGGAACDAVSEAAGLDLHIGGMLAPRLAVLVDVWGMAHRNDRVTLTQTMVTGGVRYWPTARVWLSSGLGFARATFRYDADFVAFENRTDAVVAFMGGLGFEVMTSENFALEVALRVGTGIYADNTDVRNLALTVGASWY